MRKLNALQRLKFQQQSFIKYPSGSTPLPTRHSPHTYGHLWPTLFPYGVGMMENDDVRSNDAVGFKEVTMRSHVTHLLQSGPNRRFQTHLSFMFVINNILLRRETSYNARLAVKKSWFPRVDALLDMITDSTIESYTNKLKSNPFARAETEGEKAAAKLIQHVNYVAEHVPGSMREIQEMREELFSIVNTDGMPHIFLTLNPTDTNNPIAQVLAGREIDLDKFFHDLKPGAENLERSAFISQNPVAAAEFFHHSVRILLHILLG
ncbi:hypothetical protein BT96DRAFT_829363, partial [Gymnopus androsaceus JB14]